jgi:energy-coupling factor transport system substrate-specific component
MSQSRSDVEHGRPTTALAARPLFRFRTIDLVTAAMLGVAFGVVFWAWGFLYEPPARVFDALFPPLAAAAYSPWLLGGVVAGLLIRRPGAALMTEMVGASVEALIGSHWGWTVLVSGFLQGMGVEIVLALFAWRSFGPRVAMLTGLLAATLEVVVYEWWVFVPDYTWGWKLAYLLSFAVSGAVVAGLGGLAMVRALAKTGAVNAMPAGQEELERSAR